jgi:hypothetical protein
VNLPFYFLLNVILISRLSFIFLDKALDRRRTGIMTALQLVGLLIYELNLIWVLLAGTLVLINLLFHRYENRSGKINQLRLLSLLTQVIVLSVFFSPWLDLHFNPGLSGFLRPLQDYSLLLAGMANVDWSRVNIITLGLLSVTNEANILIRYLFQIWRLSPAKAGKGDKAVATGFGIKEYNTGRIIGILERVLIYYLVLNAQFAAIGLILAAKSFTRYKELEKRAFAEYVLVGTLLSTLLAMLTAGLIQQLLVLYFVQVRSLGLLAMTPA